MKAYVVCGSPGAGKSTYAKTLARACQAVLLDIDTVTERLVKLGLCLADRDPDDRDSAYFKEHFRQPIYDQLFDIAKENLSFNNVIIVGPFTRELQDKTWLSELSLKLSAEVEVHYLYCEPSIRFKRIEQRSKGRDKAKLTEWNTYSHYYGEEKGPCFEHVYIDTSNNVLK